MIAKIKYYNKRLVIYYSKDGDILRYSTGITIPESKYLSDNMTIKSSVRDYQSLNLIVQNKLDEVNKIIKEYHTQQNSYPPVSFIKNRLEKPKNPISNTTKLIDGYNIFLEEKREWFSKKDKSISSLKDYVSTKNSLTDFQLFSKKEFLIEEVNKKLLNEYWKFLEMKPSVRGTDKNYISRGGLNQNTIRKRFNCLKSFFYYLNENEYYPLPNEIKNFKLSSEPVEMISVSKEEIKELLKIKLKDTPKKIRDTFVFSCYTGLRWSDLTTLNKSHIKKEGDVYYIDKISVKTKVEVKIPLTEWCQNFLVDMNYNLNFISNQKFNAGLKEIFKSSKLFDDLTRAEDENNKLIPRHELISIHKGRHTFISNLVKSSVPINEIMKYTGHKKLETLMKYINTQTPMTIEFIKKLEE